MFDNIKRFFKKANKNEKEEKNSKDAAKERLHLVLMQDRANVSADFLDLMRQEIIEVIKKYIDVDESAMDVRLTNQANEDGTQGAPALYANIPILNIKEETRALCKETATEKEEQPEANKAENIIIESEKQNEFQNVEEKSNLEKENNTQKIEKKSETEKENNTQKAEEKSETEKENNTQKAEEKSETEKENNTQKTEEKSETENNTKKVEEKKEKTSKGKNKKSKKNTTNKKEMIEDKKIKEAKKIVEEENPKTEEKNEREKKHEQ